MKSVSCTSFPNTQRKDLRTIFADRALTPKRCDSASFFTCSSQRPRTVPTALISQPAEDSRVCSKLAGNFGGFYGQDSHVI